MLQLEGYQYDSTAELLTARVVHVGQVGPMTEVMRSDVEVPICRGLRKLIDDTMTELTGALIAAPNDGGLRLPSPGRTEA